MLIMDCNITLPEGKYGITISRYENISNIEEYILEEMMAKQKAINSDINELINTGDITKVLELQVRINILRRQLQDCKMKLYEAGTVEFLGTIANGLPFKPKNSYSDPVIIPKDFLPRGSSFYGVRSTSPKAKIVKALGGKVEM